VTNPKPTTEAVDNGHWKFPEQLDFNKAFGFIYLIRERESGLMYIGRKNFKSLAKATKGRSSNWRVYTSSSKKLNELIEAKGKQAFQFIVLEQYYTAGGMGWAEVWSQCIVETPTNSKFLNGKIEGIQWSSKEVITQRHRDRLAKILTW
jgi:hypothetical protein